MHFLGHLGGEFAGGAEDQDLDGAAGGIGLLDGGDGEGGRLAGAGLGLAHHIVACEDHGNGRRLDGGRFLESERLDGFENGG